MRVLLQTIFVLTLVVALVALIVARENLSRAVAPLIREVALIAVAGLLGFVLAWSRRRTVASMETEPVLTLNQIDTPAPSPSDTIEERALLSFARQLLGATATEELRATVESQLPVLLHGRKVWIAGDSPNRPAFAPPAQGRQPGPVISDDVQEWTTFALRLEDQRVGLLGVESAGGLSPHLKARIQSVTPLIAQALKTAQDVDVYREASVVDLLTGAATRREGLNRLTTEVKRAQRTGSTMAVLMVDLDHFKSINDSFGHAAGDALLTAIGQTLVRTLRASDVRCRWGGEEFLIVLPETTLAQAQVVASNLLQNLAATTIASPKGPVSSTASIGLTISRPGETDVNRIVARADVALYQAKNAGRSCVRVVLGGFDGEPVATDGPRRVPTPAVADTLPFPDRRDPNRRDRRAVPSPGRRRTDAVRATSDLDRIFSSEQQPPKANNG